MKQFYLMAAAAIVVTTSLASNLLWVMAFGPKTTLARGRAQSVLGGFRDLVNVSVAAVIARSERQAASFKLDDLGERDLSDAGVHRSHFIPLLSERDAPLADASHLPATNQAGGSC
jgi:hypothetical protein